MSAPVRTEPDRSHYSYRHYADSDVAEGFDALRFSGPIGRYLAREQATLLRTALAPVPGKVVVDVGTGTGRLALVLAAAGAAVTGLDASGEMLDVARRRAADAGLTLDLSRADAHALPLPDQSVDAAVSSRVLMHVPDWQRCVAELCRVARWRVVIDFPSARSLAALESAMRRRQQRAGRAVEAYRVLTERDVAEALGTHGFRVVHVHRQFVLPIALHKTVGSLALTRGLEGALSLVGLLRLFGSPVTMVAER